MPLCATESRCEKGLNQFPGKRVTDDETTEADHVQVVVLHSLVGGEVFVNQLGPHSCHFVGGD